MDYQKLEKIVSENKDEIDRIDIADGEYRKFSDEAKEERKKFLEKQNETIRQCISNDKSYQKNLKTLKEDIEKLNGKRKTSGLTDEEQEKNKKDLKDLVYKKEECEQRIGENRKELNKLSQGKFRNLLSSFVPFQADKRVTNFLYKSKGIYNLHKKMVDKRYKKVPTYFLKNIGIIVALGVAAVIAVQLLPVASPIALTIGKIFYGVTGVFSVNTLIKGISAAYNNHKCGGHIPFKRAKDIQRGSFVENIKNSLFKRRRASLSKVKINSKTVASSKGNSNNGDSSDLRKKTLDDIVSKLRTINLEITPLEEKQDLEKLIRTNKIENQLPDDVRDTYNKIKEAVNGKNPGTNDKLNANSNAEAIDKMRKFLETFDVEKASEADLNKIIAIENLKQVGFLPKDIADLSDKVWLKYSKLYHQPDVNDYGNLGIPAMLKSDKLNYEKAMNAVIKPNSQDDEKAKAYAKLANCYNIPKKLNVNINDFDRETLEKFPELKESLKKVSELGKKIKKGEANPEETGEFARLLYGISHEDYADYLLDEHNRYQADLKEYNEHRKK